MYILCMYMCCCRMYMYTFNRFCLQLTRFICQALCTDGGDAVLLESSCGCSLQVGSVYYVRWCFTHLWFSMNESNLYCKIIRSLHKLNHWYSAFKVWKKWVLPLKLTGSVDSSVINSEPVWAWYSLLHVLPKSPNSTLLLNGINECLISTCILWVSLHWACTCTDTESLFLLLVDEISAEMFGQCAVYNRLWPTHSL